MRNVSGKRCRENQNTNLCPKNSFSKALPFFEIIWKKYYRTGQATDDNMAHAHCMLDT